MREATPIKLLDTNGLFSENKWVRGPGEEAVPRALSSVRSLGILFQGSDFAPDF